MFWYVSFLRPPPAEAGLRDPVPVTPQIANDLRTVLAPTPHDLFYAWLPARDGCTGTCAPSVKKLTTWRPASAYKETPVPPPPAARDGDHWRILLCTRPHHAVPLADLADPADAATAAPHAHPFPVLSMPIVFRARLSPTRNPPKQDQIERIYLLPSAPPLLVREQTSFDLDKKVWDSGVGLSSWIVDLHASPEPPPALGPLPARLFPPPSRHVNTIELGSGNGIVAITLAALPCPGTRLLLATDLPSAMALLTHNIDTNHARVAEAAEAHPSTPATPTKAIPTVLDWNEPLPADVRAVTGGFDLIIMADVTYNTASFPALLRTLRALLDLRDRPDTAIPGDGEHPDAPPPGSPGLIVPPSPAPSPLILLGYKERDPAERALFALARAELGVRFVRVGGRRGAGGEEVEVYVGRREG